MVKRRLLKWITGSSVAFMALLGCVSSVLASLNVVTENQFGTAGSGPFTPSWVINTNVKLLAGVSPSLTAGNFNLENQAGNRNINALTKNTSLTLSKISGTATPNYVTWGTGGTPNYGFTLLATTNLSSPIVWTVGATGVLDGNGAFTNSILVNPTFPATYFRFRML